MIIKTFHDMEIFKKRRAKLNKLAGDAVFILFSGEESHLSVFRPSSHFLYLTGFEEPSATAVIRTGKDPQFTLFVRDKDPVAELWDGERFGPMDALKEFAADQAYPASELEAQLPALMRGVDKVYYSLGDDPDFDPLLLHARKGAQQLDRRSGKGQLPIFDPNDLLGLLRMEKDEHEIGWMRDVAELSAKAHNELMQVVQPGMNERQAHAHLLFHFLKEKASREAYSSIVASGSNACVLHYRSNNKDMNQGEFLLVDAGAEKNYYCADITRTYPVDGRFTPPQRDLYQAVLDVQKKLIDAVRVGASLPEIHELSISLLTEKMLDLKLLSGNKDQLIQDKSYQKYYPHGVGHFLGLDVHDVGLSKIKEQPLPFKENVVITIEPGIYVPAADENAPKGLRGLGVRIEDDVRVTTKGPDVLTQSAVKEVFELENRLVKIT